MTLPTGFEWPVGSFSSRSAHERSSPTLIAYVNDIGRCKEMSTSGQGPQSLPWW